MAIILLCQQQTTRHYSFSHNISPRCGSLTVRVKQKHSPYTNLWGHKKWASTVQLSFCPICWREEETVSNYTGGQHHYIWEVCPFLLRHPCVACKETLFPMKQHVSDCGSPRAVWRLRFMTAPFPSHSSWSISHLPSSHTNESGHVSTNS